MPKEEEAAEVPLTTPRWAKAVEEAAAATRTKNRARAREEGVRIVIRRDGREGDERERERKKCEL